MLIRQPMGVKFLAGILILFGGFLILVTLIEIIDSIRFYGFDSIWIISPLSLAGFVVYGVTPAFLYATGVGLFMGRLWSRKAVVQTVPILLFLLFFNQALHVARLLANVPMNSLELFVSRIDVFFKFFLIYLLLAVPLIFYFTRPSIKRYFLLQKIK